MISGHAFCVEFVCKAKKKTRNLSIPGLFGGDNRDRTDDLLNAIQALSQLSYAPILSKK